MKKNVHSRQTQNFSFPRINTKPKTAEFEFLPFAGKINVMLNLSNITRFPDGFRNFCRLDIHHISEPFLLEQYVAISDYTKREESDINLKAGNVVDVIERNEHGK